MMEYTGLHTRKHAHAHMLQCHCSEVVCAGWALVRPRQRGRGGGQHYSGSELPMCRSSSAMLDHIVATHNCKASVRARASWCVLL
jgi:hypothetical protein